MCFVTFFFVFSSLDLTPGEFDFLLPLRLEGPCREDVFEVLKSSHIFYQLDYHESILAQSPPLWCESLTFCDLFLSRVFYFIYLADSFVHTTSYLQKQNEGMTISDIPLVYKTGTLTIYALVAILIP
jgi:hypothetical protein